jgi:hypothetical protein
LSVDTHYTHEAPPGDAPRLARTSNLRDALSMLLTAGAERAAVVDANEAVVGTLTIESIRTVLCVKPATAEIR